MRARRDDERCCRQSSRRSKIGCSTRRILDAWVYKSSDRPPSLRLQPVTAAQMVGGAHQPDFTNDRGDWRVPQ
jgi:hypothetical protein